MLQNKHIVTIITLFLWSAFLICSCNHPQPEPEPPVNTQSEGVYVLNEGLFQMNNSSLTYYNATNNTVTDYIFLTTNHRGLGDVGNDLQQYGSKLYCVVNNSNRVEVMTLDAVSIKAISLEGKQPRKIAFYGSKAFVSCFDGDVVQIDTATLEVEKTVHSGSNPEGICVCNGKLYVANSGGLNAPNYGTTLSVFDINTLAFEKEITVVANPCDIKSYNDRYVYVCSRGNYGSIPYAFQKVDAETDEVVRDYNLPVLNFTIYDHYAYIYNYDYSTSSSWIRVLDLNTDNITKNNFITDGTEIKTPYGITVNPLNGDVYIADAYNFTVNGDVYCFDKTGKKKFSFAAGLNPSTILIRN